MSDLYNHILTSCFLDAILVPLCTWLYLLILLIVALLRPVLQSSHQKTQGSTAKYVERDLRIDAASRYSLGRPWKGHSKAYTAALVIYFLLIIAQFLMCILEIVRLSLARLGIGLLPFTFASLVAAGVLRATAGLREKVIMWRWLNFSLWTGLAATNSVKIVQEVKEGIHVREGSKYPVVDQVTDVAVMVGVYTVLAVMELLMRS